jgi:Flp pilus assembly protein TadD
MTASTIFLKTSQSLRCAVTVLVFTLALSGCSTMSSSTLTAQKPKTQEEWRARSAKLGEAYAKNPKDKNAALNYARSLTVLRKYAQANAILRSLAVQLPSDADVLGAYGRSLIDVGRLEEAKEVLAHAHSPEQPRWHILSAQGVVEDKLGHPANAQKYYENALKIEPNEPSVLSNMAMSYALTKRLDEAEKLLRIAQNQNPSSARIRSNLAFVLGLQGKSSEAKTILDQNHTPDEVRQNLAYFEALSQAAAKQAAPPTAPGAMADAPQAKKHRKFADASQSPNESPSMPPVDGEKIQEARNDSEFSIPPEGSGLTDATVGEAYDEEAPQKRVQPKRRALGSLRGGM